MFNTSNRKATTTTGLNIMWIVGWLAFDFFNAVTTLAALEMMFGNPESYMTTVALVVALVTIDLAGLLRLFTTQTEATKEPGFVKVSFMAWLLVAGINAFLTWWFLATEIESFPVRGPSMAVDNSMVMLMIPLMISLLVLITRIVIVYNTGTILDSWLHNDGKKSIGNIAGSTAVRKTTATVNPNPLPLRQPTTAQRPPSSTQQQAFRPAQPQTNAATRPTMTFPGLEDE